MSSALPNGMLRRPGFWASVGGAAVASSAAGFLAGFDFAYTKAIDIRVNLVASPISLDLNFQPSYKHGFPEASSQTPEQRK